MGASGGIQACKTQAALRPAGRGLGEGRLCERDRGVGAARVRSSHIYTPGHDSWLLSKSGMNMMVMECEWSLAQDHVGPDSCYMMSGLWLV